MNKNCILIAGPTAVGKTSVALELAAHFNTKIISADSRQCFRELNIGVAKPSQKELERIPHYFINTHSISDDISAASFEVDALGAVEKIFATKNNAILSGGTGLYMQAFCEGMDPIPPVDPSLREHIVKMYAANGIEWLQQLLATEDPAFLQGHGKNNPQRMMRALEVKLSTGSPISSFQEKKKKQRDFNIIKIGLELPREQLYHNINNRVDAMMQQGLLEEVKALQPFKHLNALQTVGYRELFSYLEGTITLEKAIDLMKQNTRHYAKRQMTWFKKDTTFTWLPPEVAAVISYLDKRGIK